MKALLKALMINEGTTESTTGTKKSITGTTESTTGAYFLENLQTCFMCFFN